MCCMYKVTIICLSELIFSRVDDGSVRYVAEENINITQLPVSDSLMILAGKYFKRWDRPTSTFVSNIKDEYPDD